MFVVKPTSQKVKQGETALFKAQIDGYPPPNVSWLLNGKQLKEEDVKMQFNATTGEAKLAISNVDLQQHAGSITCRMKNHQGSQEETVRLDVLVAPKIIVQLPKQQEIVSGQNVILKIVGQGLPQPSAEWFFKDRCILSENGSRDGLNSEYQLPIKQATVAHNEGSYRVVLKNEVGEVQSTPCVLTVFEPVKLTKVRPTSDLVVLKIGEAFNFVVDVSGKETPKVQLVINGQAMPFTSEETTRYTFSVANVRREHQGVYNVRAENKISKEEITITLNVTGEFACILRSNTIVYAFCTFS